MKTPVLESERVILRPLTVNDAKTAFNNWTSDNRVTKYMRYNSHTSLDDTIEWLKMVEYAENSDKQYDWGFIDKKRVLFSAVAVLYGMMMNRCTKSVTTVCLIIGTKALQLK